jgi:hypothetical protein
MDARGSDRRIIRDEPCTARQHCVIVIVFSIAAMGSFITWARIGSALRDWLNTARDDDF